MGDQATLAFIVLGVTLLLFISGRVRHDIVALISLSAVALLGLAAPGEIFTGFGHPAVITVAAVLIMSAVMSRSGVVEIIAARIEPYTENQTMHLLTLCGVVAVLSAFINNVGALALMLPVALATAKQRNRNPSILLMPLAFAAILGGMTTLIGTPPNIIVSSIRGDELGAPFALFDFTPAGLPVAAAGVAFVALIGWRLLPKDRRARNAQEELFTVGGYAAELRIPEGHPLIGEYIFRAEALSGENTRILARRRETQKGQLVSESAWTWTPLSAGDVVVLVAAPDVIQKAVETHGLELVRPGEDRRIDLASELDWRDASLVEAALAPTSPLIGQSARYVDRITGRNVSVMAVSGGEDLIKGGLADRTLRQGDVLLLQGDGEAMPELLERLKLWPLAERGLRPVGRPAHAPALASALFFGAILLAALNVAPIAVALTLAVVGAVVTGLAPARQLYDDVDWSVIVLLGAMFPLGLALQNSGATEMIAAWVVDASQSFALPPWAILTLILVLTMGLSDVINNAATALLMAPIAITIAEQLGVSPDPFLIAVALGASCAFLTPIGHQCNTLVLGPGGYKFTDYWRMGLPLEIVITIVGVPLILLFWPL